MKNFMLIVVAVFSLSLVSCEKEDALLGESNPVKIENFRIDGVAYLDAHELLTANLTMKIGEGIRLEYFLRDDRKIDIHSLFVLINDDESRRRQILVDEEVNSEWLQVEQYFYLANLIRLDSDELYIAQKGDRLSFYLNLEDKAGNESARTFVVEVE